MIFNPEALQPHCVHLGSFNSNSMVYLSSDSFSGFLNNILFVWPLFGLSLKSILPETPLGSPLKGMGYEGVNCTSIYTLCLCSPHFLRWVLV